MGKVIGLDNEGREVEVSLDEKGFNINWRDSQNGGYDSDLAGEDVVKNGMPDSKDFVVQVWDILDSVGNLLIEKNLNYGNSALEPIRVFSKADKIEQLKVRIDDKLKRISNGVEGGDEDTVNDLIGYLVLYKIAKGGI